MPANGLLWLQDSTSVLFDSGWNDAQTRALLRWAADSLHRPVRLAVITHAHPDRLGGLATPRAAGVRAIGLPLTAALARAAGMVGVSPIASLEKTPVTFPGFELYYPGAGHTGDNIVAYVPASHLLFGGCLVKEAGADDLGNIRNADLPQWPLAVAAVQARYGHASIVVPGHGAPGSLTLLTHTASLLAVHRGRAGSDE